MAKQTGQEMWEEIKTDIKKDPSLLVAIFFACLIVGVVVIGIFLIFWNFPAVMFTLLFGLIIIVVIGAGTIILIGHLIEKYSKEKNS